MPKRNHDCAPTHTLSVSEGSPTSQTVSIQHPNFALFLWQIFYFFRLNLDLDLNFADPFFAPLLSRLFGSNSVKLYLSWVGVAIE